MTTKPKRILVVDDVADLRHLLAMQLQWAGYEVLQAGDGQTGFDLARRQDVDLVISDKEMPGGDGFELLQRLRAADVQRPVIFIMTGSPGPVAELAHALGAEAVFVKPFPVAMLLEAVKRFRDPFHERLAERPEQALPPGRVLELALDEPAGTSCLGRGGVFVPSPGFMPEQHEKLAFTITLPNLSLEAAHPVSRVEGVGIVRWVRAAGPARPSGFGLEFTQLTPEAARYLARWSAARGIVPFIPNR